MIADRTWLDTAAYDAWRSAPCTDLPDFETADEAEDRLAAAAN